MPKIRILAALFLVATLTACGSDSSSNGGNNGAGDNPDVQAANAKCANTPKNPGVDIRYVYSESTNGVSCTTGCQIFTSGYDYCAGLQNDELNNNCAADARRQSYLDFCTRN